MKKMIRLVVMMGLAVSGLASLADEVLFWMVDNPTISDWYNTQYRASEAGDHGRTIEMARVAAFKTADTADYLASRIGNPDGTHPTFEGDVVYLDLYYQEGGSWTLDNPTGQGNDYAFVEGGSFLDVKAFERAAVLASIVGKEGLVNLSEYSFAIELGTFDANDTWVLAAVSGTETYANLSGYISDQVEIPTDLPWSPNAYAAPEPTSGLLMVIGFALLGLKRKKVVGCHNRGRDVLVASKEMKTALI